jgi:hypothetical protein
MTDTRNRTRRRPRPRKSSRGTERFVSLNRLQGHSESRGPSPLRSRTRTTTRTITKEVASAARETLLVPS